MANPQLARLTAWARQNRGLVGAAGLGAAGGAFMLLRRKQSGAASGSTSAVAAPGASTYSGYGSAGYYDSTAVDVYNSILPQLEALQHQITAAGLQPGPAAAPTSKPDLAGYPGSGQLWSAFQDNQVGSGQFTGKAGFEDWGVIAASVLGPTATRFEVQAEANKLMSLNPTIAGQSAASGGYVPVSAVSGLKTS